MNNEKTFAESANCYADCYDNLALARSALMNFDDVIGVGIGPKQRDGKLDTSVVCFLVYVKSKRLPSELEAKAFIPKEFSGVMTDVVEVGCRLFDIHNEFDARWIKQSRVASRSENGVDRLVV